MAPTQIVGNHFQSVFCRFWLAEAPMDFRFQRLSLFDFLFGFFDFFRVRTRLPFFLPLRISWTWFQHLPPFLFGPQRDVLKMMSIVLDSFTAFCFYFMKVWIIFVRIYVCAGCSLFLARPKDEHFLPYQLYTRNKKSRHLWRKRYGYILSQQCNTVMMWDLLHRQKRILQKVIVHQKY